MLRTCSMKCAEVPGDLRVGRAVVGHGRRYRLRVAQPVDLNDPRRDRAAGGLPDEAASQHEAETKRAEAGQTPVLRLDAG